MRKLFDVGRIVAGLVFGPILLWFGLPIIAEKSGEEWATAVVIAVIVMFLGAALLAVVMLLVSSFVAPGLGVLRVLLTLGMTGYAFAACFPEPSFGLWSYAIASALLAVAWWPWPREDRYLRRAPLRRSGKPKPPRSL